ncbi:MAG: HAMP domain-containing sensor histidine kinase [Chitinophagales bacterium]
MNFWKKHKVTVAAVAGMVLLTVSVLIDSIQMVSPNVYKAKRIIERKLHAEELAAEKMVQSPKLLTAADSYEKIRSVNNQYNEDGKILLYVYKEDALVFWSTNSFVPENIDKLSERDIHFLKEANGFYEVIHKASDDHQVNIYALIPVYYQYSTNNKFLSNGFVWNHPFLKRFVVSNKETSKTTAVTSHNGAYLFSIRVADNANTIYNPYIVLVEILGLLLLFWSMYQIIKQMLNRRRYWMAFVCVLLVALFTELMCNQLKLFSLTKTSLLFSSNLYASAYWSNTLGALLIRIFLLNWSISFLRFIPSDKIRLKYIYLLLALPVTMFFVMIFVMQSVIQNSVISFNFYLINTLDRYTFISLVVFGLLISGLLYWMKWIFDRKPGRQFAIYLLVYTFIGWGIGFLIGEFTDFFYTLFLVLWLFTFFLFFYYEHSFIQNNRKYRFIANLVLLSLIAFLTSVVVIYNTSKKDIEKRKYRMEELVAERDVGEEYGLIETEQEILQDNFIKSYFKSPYLSNFDVDKRISSKYFKQFAKRYHIQTYMFDKDGMPLVGIAQKEFYKLNNARFYKKAKSISPNFYYLSIKENGEKYLGYFPIKEEDVLLGYLFVELIPKIFSSYSAYPELLLKQKNYYDEEFDNFSYAIYDNKYLVKQKGEYEYQIKFNFPVKPDREFNYYKNNDYNHMIYYGKDKQIVLSESNQPALSTLSVFSYILIFFLFFFILMDYFGFSERFWGNDSLQNFLKGNTLQKQIQNSMITLVLFSLLVIGIVTMVYFQYQYNLYHNNRLLKKVNTVMKNVTQYYLEEYPLYGSNTFDKVIQQKTKTLSTIHSLDINVYSPKGELLQSSQPEIFKRNLISEKMDAGAYYNLIIKGKSKFVQDETVGNLTYLSAYQPFRSNGKVLGYFNFPYYGKQKSFQEDLSYFLVALVNVYVIFLIAAAFFAVVLSRSITNSLTLISESIKGLQFGKTNTPIAWKNEDEIGLLVKQYNLMLAELEKSADLLAKSEREGAWREMAKQVAHEIKNPLTPMKLSIQHLQRALRDDSPDIKEMTEKISQRLIEQIDNLSNIATAFSDFAKMPQGSFEKIDSVPLLMSTIELFRELDNIEISVSSIPEHAYVFGDREQLMRVFTNVIKNATQAIPESKEGRIEIEVKEIEDSFIFTVKDNGVGISEEKRTHIFEPNFTTKSSGTGLGLAISKNIVERMNGKIWFDSIINDHTVFYIQLPKWKDA